MFILDSLMISGIRWTLRTILTAAEAESDDDTALRERLMEAELRREMGEISDEEFSGIEAELLARIRENKERRGGTGPLTHRAQPIEASPGSAFDVEAEVTGDFHAAPAHDVKTVAPKRRRRTAGVTGAPAAPARRRSRRS